MPRLIHRLAMVALVVVAAQSILLTLKPPFPSNFERIVQPIIAVALWSFLVWKIWRKPRKWGLGIGVFLLAMIGLQTHLWLRAIKDPEKLRANGFDPSVGFFVLWEVPLVLAAVLCISLRWRGPADAAIVEGSTKEL